MASAVDLHIGKRLNRRRRLLGMTLQQLAEAVGIRFQQVQKYEGAANRVTASRLYDLSIALEVPVSYFFEGLATQKPNISVHESGLVDVDSFSQETLDLIRTFHTLDERSRRRLLRLAKAFKDSDAEDNVN